MGATPNLGLRWPELPSQADGPAAFQNLATDVENKMTNLVGTSQWNGDASTHVDRGAVVTVFTQDVAATAIGWAWVDINLAIAVFGPSGGRFPANLVQNTGGSVAINQNTTTLRTLRWHSRQRAEYFSVGGGVAVPLPTATTLIQVRLVMNVDSSSDAYGADLYEYSVSVTQFGAARG